ncbi:hypothetical protein OGAPHI_006402 [Ogataea philodendri]|uniref:Protoheme IX farnesyltransferase, mitochondrial n=1 Tax=Ogataea philodendri TaxID=1378263 RepID=A0A9P8NY29_9ASCO|nr:uncharacterized protein OGAPHI_006402 [Ogataea philodendri]KAH3661554.1 hypothetical protein OGAPHI_006402 [Ogataea philodendri]
MWNLHIPGVPTSKGPGSRLTHVFLRSRRTNALFGHISVRHFYYYSNQHLSNVTTDFEQNENLQKSSKLNVQFDPNYKHITFAHPSKSKIALVDEDTKNVLKSVAKSTLACHPQTNGQNLPFGVKSKMSSGGRFESSVLQRAFEGQKLTLKQLCAPYLALTKPNLTFLIMLSSICSYALAPHSTNIAEFIYLTIGTLLSSGSANAINMGREPGFDKMMIRTQARPVVRGAVTPREAYAFASVTGLLGCGILYYGVNPTVAILGLLNIVLYSWIYTSLKRVSILNTWVGAVVGAIPPLMGWAACSSLSDPGAWCLALLLYAWQFPHFNSLSHNIRDEYKRAGYVMTAFENPKLNARVALRYSLFMFPICYGLCYYNVTDPFFMFDSSILNGWMAYMSFKFWWQQRINHSSKVIAAGGPSNEAIALANQYAKKTFWSSIWQLPVVLVLAMLHKKGQWDRSFHSDDRSLTA